MPINPTVIINSLQGTLQSMTIGELSAELARADAKFGPQYSLPDGTEEGYGEMRDLAQHRVQEAATAGTLTWRDILEEELAEALYEHADDAALLAEVIQVAAVAVRWAVAIQARQVVAALAADEATS